MHFILVEVANQAAYTAKGRKEREMDFFILRTMTNWKEPAKTWLPKTAERRQKDLS